MDLAPEKLSFCLSPPEEREAYRSPSDLEALLDEWAQRGALVEEVGHSKEGRPIRCAVLGSGERTLLAWGYPHPDEPLGSEALCWLGEGLLSGALSLPWRVALILCADPDEAARQLWRPGPRDASNFCHGAWRPLKLDWGVDYGFPLDWGPFWQPDDGQGGCRTLKECLESCGPMGCSHGGWPHAPLPESLALSRAIDRYEPSLVAAMHNTHTGGDYTFLLERERREVLDALVDAPSIFGQSRHLGEAVDRGRRWMADAPDLIHEPDLATFLRRLERLPDYDPELAYRGNHSAAAYLEAKGWGAQFVCPETTRFRHPDFGDASLLGETALVRRSVEERRRGRYAVARVRDEATGEWLVATQSRTEAPLARGRARREPLTRGMLGVLALARRRRAMSASDALWPRALALAPEGFWHPYMEERRLLTTPGAYVGDHSQLIFRTRPDYARAATRAQAASFAWLWPAHTAATLGSFQVYLSALPPSGARDEVQEALSALQEGELAALPDEVRQEGPRGPAMASMLARVLLLMQAQEQG
jgi:hypothetical protein